MSKLRIRFVVVLLVGLCLAAPSNAQRTGQPLGSPAASTPAKMKGLSASDEILKKVASLRGLPVLTPVPSGLKSRSEIQAVVLKNMGETTTPQELANSSSLLRFLGLVPSDFDLEKETTALLTEQIAGFYDPKSRYFYLADWIPLDDQRPIIAHELTHALTDQHFDLRRFEKWPDGDGDAELAAHALVEGDATALMFEFSLAERNAPHDLGALPVSLMDLLKGSLGQEDPEHPVLNRAPAVLRESLEFPYLYGLGFTQTLLKNGGWQKVSAAYKKLPASTEQIIHPDKYLSNEAPVVVEIADLATQIGAGYKRVQSDVNGEFGYYLILRESLGADRAEVAAAGWGGDTYGFYLKPGGGATLVQGTVWDSTEDAEEFARAYKERIAKRYPNAAGIASDSAAIEWKTDLGLAYLERRGNRVVIIEGFRGEDVAPLAAAIWKSRGLASQG